MLTRSTLHRTEPSIRSTHGSIRSRESLQRLFLMLALWDTRSSSRNQRESDAPKLTLSGQCEGIAVTVLEQLFLVVISTAPHGADGMNHIGSGQPVPLVILACPVSQPPSLRHSSRGVRAPLLCGWLRPLLLHQVVTNSPRSRSHLLQFRNIALDDF